MKNKNYFTGLLFIAIGIGIVLNKLGYIQDINIFRIGLSIMLGYSIAKNIWRRNIFGILVPLALIFILKPWIVGLNKQNVLILLPASIFISIGISIIFKPRLRLTQHKGMDQVYTNNRGGKTFETTFSDVAKYLRTEDIKDLSLEATFSSMKVYFDEVELEDGLNDIFLETTFGSMELLYQKTGL